MKSNYLAGGLLLLSALNVHAGSTTFGSYDCGQWVNAKDNNKKAWLMGYVSGLNTEFYESSGRKDPLNKLNSAEQMFLWVENYCEANPLSDLKSAGYKLLEELKN